MKRPSLLLMLSVVLHLAVPAQSPGADPFRSIRKAIQQYAWSTPTADMENYAWLQQLEMPYFARDTFTMTWGMDRSNLLVLPWDSGGVAWKAIFDPVWPNGSQAPIHEQYELRGKSCPALAGQGHFIQDIGFEFGLDSAFRVLEVTPLVEVRENGYLRRVKPEDLLGADFSECLKVTYRGNEATSRHLVGQHYRTVQKMEDRMWTEDEKLEALLDRAVREAYPGFRILTIETCHEKNRACWYEGDALSMTLKTYGRITAATGPKELQFEAVFHFPENEEPAVDQVRVFK